MRWLDLPGTTGNRSTTPDSAAVSVTGDLDLRIDAALVSWASGLSQHFFAKNSGTPNISYDFILQGSGVLQATISQDGSTSPVNVASTVAIGFTAGSRGWARVTVDIDNGAGGVDVKFWKSTDYNADTGTGSWTQIGTTRTVAGALTNIKDGAAQVSVGANNAGTGNLLNGKVYRTLIYSGIDGSRVADFNPNLASDGATSVVAATGETWSLAVSGSPHARFEDDLSMFGAPACVASMSPSLTTAIQLAGALAAQAGLSPAIATQILLSSGPSSLAAWIGSLNTAIMGAAAASARATLIADLRALEFDPEFVIAADREFGIQASRSFAIASR